MSLDGSNIKSLMLPDAESVSASNVLVSLATYVDSIPVKSFKNKRGKAKQSKADKGKVAMQEGGSAQVGPAQGGSAQGGSAQVETAQGGSAQGAAVVTPGVPNLTCAKYRKVYKGGRTPDPDCDASRRKIYVPVYHDGPFKGMWNIDPLGDTVTPQTAKLYKTLAALVKDETTYKVYVCAPSMGHMWFPRVDGGITSHLSGITLNAHHYNFWWTKVTTNRANIDKQQSTISKIINTLVFSPEMFNKVEGVVHFTFDAEKCTAQANALLKNGAGGGRANVYRGRAVLVAIHGPVP